jgi:hypothetical protein
MVNRKRFRWNVTLASSSGEVSEVEVENYWSPDYEGISEEVARATAATATCAAPRGRDGKPTHGYQGISAALV